MGKKTETKVADQLAEIRRQRLELAREQVQEAAVQLAAGEKLSVAGGGLLGVNLELLGMDEAAFDRMVRQLARVPSLEARVVRCDQLGLVHQVEALEKRLAEMVASHREEERKLVAEIEPLRQTILSVSLAADALAAIRQAYPRVGLPNVQV